MPCSRTLIAASLLAAAPLASLVSASPLELVTRQQQDPNTPLYLNSPFCDYFQCAITWKAGDQAVVNWLNAPAGDVQVDLMTNSSSVLAYPIAEAPAVSNSCDAGSGYGVAVAGTTCGGFVFTVPSSWSNGNYSMRATSVQNPSLQSYTDVILIQNAPNPSNVPFAVVSGTIEGSSASASQTSAASQASSSSSSATSAAATSSAATTGSSSSTRSSSSAASSPTGQSTNSGSNTVRNAALVSTAALALAMALVV